MFINNMIEEEWVNNAPYGAFCESFIFDFVQFRCNLEHKFVVSITIIEIWIADNSDLESVSENEYFRLELSWNVWHL